MKSAIHKAAVIAFIKISASLLIGLSSTAAHARPGVCDVDCKARSKTRYACGVNASWKGVSTKMCEDINYPALWACEAARSTACKLGETFEESGSQGPKMHYERFQLLPYENVFENPEIVSTNLTLLSRAINYFNIEMLNDKGMEKAFGGKLEYLGDNSDTLVRQIQELDNWAKWATIVCTKEDYAKLKGNMPYYYLKQIPLADYCKLRWQHLSNNWANGFQRNRSRLECEATWGLQGLERGPLTFTCGNRMASIEAHQRLVDNATRSDFDAYAEATKNSIDEFLKGVEWSKTKEVTDAQVEVKREQNDLFASLAKKAIFEAEIQTINTQIEAEARYQKELEEKLGRIIGFIESYKSFIASEAAKIDQLEITFTDRVNELTSLLKQRNEQLAAMEAFNAKIKDLALDLSQEAVTGLPRLQREYEALNESDNKDLCLTLTAAEKVTKLQSIQAYRIDLADRLISSLDYFEDAPEFIESKRKFISQAENLSKSVSTKNYIYGRTFDALRSKPKACREFAQSKLILDALAQSAALAENAGRLDAIRQSFSVRLEQLKTQQRVLEQKVQVRNQIYSIRKSLEDNFNAGYLTQLLKEHKDARSRMQAAAAYAKTLLPEAEQAPIRDELAQSLAYFDQRSAAYVDPKQLKQKLQNRLNRLINDIADYKDVSDDAQFKAVAADIESMLAVVFSYNADRVTAIVPGTDKLNELSGYDQYLTDVEDRFNAIKEVAR
jgi:hypothetical protein